jgi:hypothetical protein
LAGHDYLVDEFRDHGLGVVLDPDQTGEPL